MELQEFELLDIVKGDEDPGREITRLLPLLTDDSKRDLLNYLRRLAAAPEDIASSPAPGLADPGAAD